MFDEHFSLYLVRKHHIGNVNTVYIMYVGIYMYAHAQRCF